MGPTTRKLTVADYERIPPDAWRHEIIEGEEFMTPAPEVSHQRISRKPERILDQHVTAHALGEILHAPIDVVLSNEDVVQDTEGQTFESAILPGLTIRVSDLF